jgi:hypothetical protein
VVLHLKWRRVAAGPNIVSTSDRYVAIQTCPGSPSFCTPQLSVLDEQTGRRQMVAVPSSCGPDFAPDGFGGPYLAVRCTGASHWLYSLNSQQWVSVSPKCPGDCNFVGVGSYWLKFDSNENPGCSEHCANTYFLQSIETGQIEPDPAKPGGRTLDDLNAPSGAAPLCAPLRYPTSDNAAAGRQELGGLQFAGPFALASWDVYSIREGLITLYQLDRCGSRGVFGIQNASPHYPPFISSRAVVSLGLRQVRCTKHPYGLACTNQYYVSGVYLHGLRQFTASLPTTTVPQYAWPGEVVGLTRRTIYVDAPSPDGTLWAANPSTTTDIAPPLSAASASG